jgi:POT family proton-dependent oligopeptide transporter
VNAAETHTGRAEWFGQPRGLTILFLTDMWEQFSYFGMRSLLVYYMMKQLLLGQKRASIIYGLYTAFVYLTPLIGGLICDRWLGRRNSVILGGLIMALGHFFMAWQPLFFLALVTIGIGNGLFLPSLPSQVNDLYRSDDPRRSSAYNYYYVGVNLGAFMAPLAIGTVGEIYGWDWGFSLAGVGMLIGLAIYVAGERFLPPEPLRGRRGPEFAESPGEPMGRRFALLAGIGAAAVVFRIAYEQVGNTLPLWIEQTDRRAGSFVIPMTWFQSLNPLLIFLFTPWLVRRWLTLAGMGREPTAIRKMAFGACGVAFAYALLAAVSGWCHAHGTRPSWTWVVAFFVLMTAGELFILPIGLGLFGRLAPRGFSATSIAVWLLGAFGGNLAAGAFGTQWSRFTQVQFFLMTALIAAISALILLFFDGPVKRLDGRPTSPSVQIPQITDFRH